MEQDGGRKEIQVVALCDPVKHQKQSLPLWCILTDVDRILKQVKSSILLCAKGEGVEFARCFQIFSDIDHLPALAHLWHFQVGVLDIFGFEFFEQNSLEFLGTEVGGMGGIGTPRDP